MAGKSNEANHERNHVPEEGEARPECCLLPQHLRLLLSAVQNPLGEWRLPGKQLDNPHAGDDLAEHAQSLILDLHLGGHKVADQLGQDEGDGGGKEEAGNSYQCWPAQDLIHCYCGNRHLNNIYPFQFFSLSTTNNDLERAAPEEVDVLAKHHHLSHVGAHQVHHLHVAPMTALYGLITIMISGFRLYDLY